MRGNQCSVLSQCSSPWTQIHFKYLLTNQIRIFFHVYIRRWNTSSQELLLEEIDKSGTECGVVSPSRFSYFKFMWKYLDNDSTLTHWEYWKLFLFTPCMCWNTYTKILKRGNICSLKVIMQIHITSSYSRDLLGITLYEVTRTWYNVKRDLRLNI